MKNLSHEEIASLCLELSLLLHAGVGLSDALALLGEEAGRENRALLESMARRMDEGSTLAAAMREEGCFPAYVWGLVEVGERSGRTEEALAGLSRYYEERVRMDRRIRSALLYPAVMLGLMLVVIAVLLVKVLPIFDDVYASLGGQLSTYSTWAAGWTGPCRCCGCCWWPRRRSLPPSPWRSPFGPSSPARGARAGGTRGFPAR